MFWCRFDFSVSSDIDMLEPVLTAKEKSCWPTVLTFRQASDGLEEYCHQSQAFFSILKPWAFTMRILTD